MDDNQNQDDSQNTDSSSNTDNSGGDQASQDQASQDNSQPTADAAPTDSSPTADAAPADSAPAADQAAQDAAASTSDQAAASDNSLQWDANTGTWTAGAPSDQAQAQADTANAAGYGETAGTDYASSPYAGINPNTDASGNPTGWNPGSEVSQGNLMLDPNNAGQVTSWSPAQVAPGLAQSDLAGTWAAPQAAQVAAAQNAPAVDQFGNMVRPDGSFASRAGTWATGSAEGANPADIAATHGAPPFTPGAPVPYPVQHPGSGTPTGPQWRPAGGMGYDMGGGYGRGGAGFGNVNISPNISPVFNNYAAGAAQAAQAARTARTPVRGAGYFGSMASSSPDVWYGLQGPGWGGYSPTAMDQPMTPEQTPWHPLGTSDAEAINAAMGIPTGV